MRSPEWMDIPDFLRHPENLAAERRAETRVAMTHGFVWDGTVFEDGSRDDRWVREDVWIVRYPSFNAQPRAHFIVYRATQTVPCGRKPWLVNNRRQHQRPFFEFKEALELARMVVGEIT